MKFFENGIYLELEIAAEGGLKLLHFGSRPFDEKTILDEKQKTGFRLVEVQMSGIDRPEERHGTKFTVTAPGYRLKYDSHRDSRNSFGRKLEFVTTDQETGTVVTSHFQFYDGVSVVRCWTCLLYTSPSPRDRG